MKKYILKTSLLVLLLSFVALQHIAVNMFVENTPLHSHEDKVEKEKESKENFFCILSFLPYIYIHTFSQIISLDEQLNSFDFKDKLFRPPIV